MAVSPGRFALCTKQMNGSPVHAPALLVVLVAPEEQGLVRFGIWGDVIRGRTFRRMKMFPVIPYSRTVAI